jgi:hypothetical protein
MVSRSSGILLPFMIGTSTFSPFMILYGVNHPFELNFQTYSALSRRMKDHAIIMIMQVLEVKTDNGNIVWA